MKKKYPFLVLFVTLTGWAVVTYGQEPTVSNSSSPQHSGQAHADLGLAGVSEATTINMSDLPEGLGPANVLPPPRPRSGVSEEEYLKRKAEAAKGLGYAPSGARGPAPSDQSGQFSPSQPYLPITASKVFGAQSELGATPADMAVAVSSSYVVQLVNSSIAVYNKSGVLQAGFPKSLSSFFSSNSGDMGDVRAFYDWSAGRFVVLADDFTAGVVHLAASTTSNPLGSWRQYSFNPWGAANCRASGNSCPDFPQLGYDDSTIYIGVNFFPASGGVSDWMLLLPKSKIYSGSGFGYNYWFNLNWGGVNVDTVHPAVLLTAAEHPIAGVAVNTFNINFGIYSGGCQNGLLVWAFSNNLTSSPTITAAFTGTANNYCMPPSANQPGWANSIDTGDVRISGTPIYHAGMIAASFNTNAGDAHSHSLWFQARPFLSYNGSNWQMAAVQLLAEDCFYCGGQGTNGSSFYGALSFNDGGDLSMIYNYSDDNTYPESAYTGRHAMNYLANYMEGAGFVMCGGSGLYGQGRWGDYEANVADLSSNLTNYSWFSGMNDSGGNWGTCIGKLSFPRYD